MYKIIFLHIKTAENHPLKLIPMDLEIPIIPMLMIFLMNLYIVFLILWFLYQSWYFNWRGLFMFVHEPFTSFICQQCLYIIYVINRFWKGNGYFIK